MVNPKPTAALEPNPFLNDLAIPVTRMLPEDGEHYDLERNTPTCLHLNVHFMDVMLNLSDAASKMLLFIMATIQPRSETVIISMARFAKRTGKKRSYFMAAKAELVRYRFIEKQTGDTYWVNPAIIFRGGRPSKFTDKVVVKHQIKVRKSKPVTNPESP